MNQDLILQFDCGQLDHLKQKEMNKKAENKEARLKALNRSEATLKRIKKELNVAGYEDNSTEFAEGFASKLLIEFNKTLIKNEQLLEDVENLKKQIINSLKK